MADPLRDRADACPGVFATHDAADGGLARVRLPGGRITAAQLRVLAGCAEDLGDGAAHLTSRGNVQLRGLDRDDHRLITRLSGAGLLPEPTHERVRNFLASPLSGLSGGLVDVTPLVAELDAAVCARPELAGLPGRFLFAVDDGRGDVSGEDPDVCWRAVSASAGTLLLGGRDTGTRVPVTAAVATLVEIARRFLALRGSAWRVRELTDPGVLTDAPPTGGTGITTSTAEPCPLGEFERNDGGRGMVVAPVLGELSAEQLRKVAELAEWAVVTPWRSLVLPTARDVSGSGLVTDPAAPAARISACIGRPGCAKARADVRAQARRRLSGPLADEVRVHYSGCERGCGKPRRPCVEVVAGKEER
ncbi:MAG TPA: precorrin-3B synthase [Amycolatopsis sp.]|jgi:precorrin-3B synthase|nr:precorrin-3B synthase [Amycolatopsis sp.]